MRLDTRALTLTGALLWGGGMLLAGLANLIWSGYAAGFLEVMASLYPGYGGPGGVGSVVVASLYGVLDGALAGFLVAWLYNLLAG
jgi:hypothetical protein